jgi:hypothetical protein
MAVKQPYEKLSTPVPKEQLCRNCNHPFSVHRRFVGCTQELRDMGGPGICRCEDFVTYSGCSQP